MSNKHQQLKLHQSFIFNPKHYRLFALGLFAFLCAYIVASTFTPVQTSDASTVIINNNTSDFFIQITSADTLPLSVTAKPTGQLSYKADTINVTTNSDNGYKLYVSTSSNDNNIYQGGDASTASEGYFQPGSGTIAAPAALSQNTWGFALNKSQSTSISSAFADVTAYVNDTGAPTTESTWAAVPTFANSETAKISEYNASNYPDGTNLDIYYGVNASTTLPTGNYATEVTYTAFSEGVNVFPTMQDFTSAQCDAMGTNTSINLSDARDDKYYRVTKMADGHCWMTDNLALGGTDKAGNQRTLTPNDSNVTSNYTFPAGTDIENDTTSVDTAPQIYSGNANDVTSECDSSYPDCVVNTSTKYGNLYNFMAATAGQGTASFSGTATQSVCPKGWRLPDNTGDFSYANLFGKYGLPTADSTDQSAVQTVQQSPLNFSLTGRYDSSSMHQAYSASYLSRTVANNISRIFVFHINSEGGNFLPLTGGNKYYGQAVRCVFAGQSDEIMQNFTATQCTNLAESTAEVDNRKTMIDSRDGKFYTISKLADGNCWMTSNLALDGMDGLGTVRTITTADSNVTQDRTLATNITNGTASDWNNVQIYSRNANWNTASCGSYPDCIISNVKYGNLYNWSAATAGVGKQGTTTDVTESVCPKSWQLPSITGAKSFNGLLSAYALPTTNGTNHSAVQTIQKFPLNFPLAGGYYNASSNQGFVANYWSKTVYDANAVVYLAFNSEDGNFLPQKLANKFYGFSVRCIFSN